MEALVIGYYERDNMGDDAYVGIIPRYFPSFKLKFINSDELSEIKEDEKGRYKAIIVGGGDLINDYFNNKIKPFLEDFGGMKIAFSVGIPFPELIKYEYLEMYDHVFTRNFEDIRDIQKLIGTEKVHYVPDACLGYECKKVSKSIKNKTCGVFLVGNMIKYDKIVRDISRLISRILLTHEVIFYCFDTTNDADISKMVMTISIEMLKKTHSKDFKLNEMIEKAKKNYKISVDEKKYEVDGMLQIMSNLSFNICMRYHSHIFSIIANTPFMSISSTRKTRSLMKHMGLSGYQYEIPLDAYSNPISSDYKSMRKLYKKILFSIDKLPVIYNEYCKKSKNILFCCQADKLMACSRIDLTSNVYNFIKSTNDFENGARIISNHVVGYPDSPYVWGMYDKFKNAKDNLISIIDNSINYLSSNVEYQSNNYSSNSKKRSLPIYVDMKEYESYKDIHRGGWYIACKKLSSMCSVNEKGNCNGILCDMYVDRTFHWANRYMSHTGRIPYTSPWCGFIHHTSDTTYSTYNTTYLFQNPEFLASLTACVALFVLSGHLANFVLSELKKCAPHVQLFTLYHPISLPSKLFSFKNFFYNKEPMLINIGAWMRNPFTIYLVDDIPYTKSILVGKNMQDYIPPKNFKVSTYQGDFDTNFTTQLSIVPCRSNDNIPRWVSMFINWLSSLSITPKFYHQGVLYIEEQNDSVIESLNNKISSMISQVQILNHKNNDDYDSMLSNNIIFLDLIDAAAVNTIIECIVRNTPILINKIPGTVDILGEDYPLFYDNVSSIPSILTSRNIKLSKKYLKSIDSNRFSFDNFINSFGIACQNI